MNKYIEHLLQLYKDKKFPHETALSLLESYKRFGENKESDIVAVVGLACKMPMADSKEEFWERLQKGTNCISSFPAKRKKDTDPLFSLLVNDLHSSKDPYWRGGFLSSVDSFDNDFFHILPAEARIMDPQQRIFLEVAHAAFEDAGYTLSKLRGSNTGVYIGDVVNEYRKIVTDVSPIAVIGNISPFIASRVSYFYDLHGPTINVSTTCSTSLVGVHLACQSLLTHESDLLLVGAINLRLFPFAFKEDPVDALGITTKDGACFAFDNRANGIVRGEGAGALVLKRYKDAVKDKDSIYALIRGSHVNNDGRSSNVGAPNPLAHTALLKKTWERSEIDPRQISYIEAHGTGTRIGDPIEVQGISNAFTAFTQDKQFCGIGSVKTNIGHLTGGASGLAGLIKTILALHHEQIPPSLHFETPNEFIDFPNTPLFVTDRLTPWPRNSFRRIAGISAFGFNGTNCHMVLEEAPLSKKEAKGPSKTLPFLFTHKSASGLKKQIERYSSFLEKNSVRIEDLSYTLAFGRDHHPVQHLIWASSLNDLCKQLRNYQGDPQPAGKIDWETPFRGLDSRIISLPTYVFEHKRFWLESPVWNKDDSVAQAPSFKEGIEMPIVDQLVHLFQEAMGLEKIELTDSFFDLGGDSLLGMEIISLVHKRINKKITYQELFQNPRIIDLAELLKAKESSLFQHIPKAPTQEEYPLSYGQRRLWILHQMQDNPIAYNIYDTYQFDCAIDLVAFQEALDQLLERHVGFRTCFVEKNGEPHQKITDQKRFDLTILSASSMENAIEKICAFREKPFDLENGPLGKALLLSLSSTCSLFFFMIHHIISDGWSIRIIIEELLKLYRKAALKPLRIHTIDYCHWQQHQEFNQERFKELEDFWLKRFTSPLPVCEIPGDRLRPPVFNFKGAKRSFNISKKIEEKLLLYGGKENATFFMVLLASIYVLIYRYTSQTDLIVGSPVLGRSHSDLKSLVGFFVNTLALRCILNPTESFAQFLRQVRDRVLEDFEHQGYPFDHLIDQLKLERDTSRSPLFNINVAYQNFEIDAEAQKALFDLKMKKVNLPHHSCKWDLEFEFVKEPGGVFTCYIEYYQEIYSEEMISILISTYQTLLQGLAEGFEKSPSSIALFPLSYAIAGPSVSYRHLPLHELFEEQAARVPDHPAIKTFDRVYSYKELNESANRLAHFLKFELQLQTEERVGLYLENSPEAIIGILGILKAGGAYVPLNNKSPLDRIQFIIDEANIRCMVSVKKELKKLNELQWSSSLSSYICLDSEDIDQEMEEVGSNFMDPTLWNQVANEAKDDITASGWVSSYTGHPFSIEEMEDYKNNLLSKLRPYLHSHCRVLEIGCGSGLTAFSLAPHVGYYRGVDLSDTIVDKNRLRAEEEALSNLHFSCCAAHQIDDLNERPFDILILNSVIHCFAGHHYLKHVLRKAIVIMKDKALFFLGDLMDLDLKEPLKESLYQFKEMHRNEGYRTKLEWKGELFLSREFLNDLRGYFPISQIVCSKKEYTIENELTRFRFDALLTVDKTFNSPQQKKKRQYDRRSIDAHPDQDLKLSLSDKNLAYVLFTSGSTGLPKGVMVEHRSVHNYIHWAIDYYKIDFLRFPLHSPLHFDLTVTSIFAPLLSGDFLHILTGEIDEICENFKKTDGCTLLKLTPTHLTMLSEKQSIPSEITQFIVGGETLYASQAVQISSLYEKPIQIYNEYGPTEATVGCIVHRWDPSEREGALLIGTPIANCKVHLFDEQFQPVPVGGIGEILIEGECLARGYLNRDDLTVQKFKTDPKTGALVYCTGDLGRYLPNQKIAYVGRKDRQVKIKGYRIELDEIENCLLKHPSIKAATVVAKENRHHGRVLLGYYVPLSALPPEEVALFLSETLPSYMMPSFLIPIKSLPVTHNGKIDAARLPDPDLRKTKTIMPPQSAIESKLHAIWCRLLNISESELSIEDDFFDLGGDSIMAMRILPQVKKLGLQLSIKEIFQYRTIKALGQRIHSGPLPVISQEEVKGSLPWAPIQRWFWNQQQENPAYFTMAYLFSVPANILVERLESAFEICFSHHDALRICVNGNEQLVAASSELQFQIEEYELEHLNAEQQQEEILRLTAKIQDSFDLSLPPLVKAAVFDLGHGEKRLFLAIHHLIIDGVSWRYLIEDLSTLYASCLQQALTPKTHSYQVWTQKLHNLPLIERKEILEWLDIDPGSFPKLSECSLPMISKTKETFLYFSKEETLTLISNTRSFYDANPNELLLSALILSLEESFGIEKALIHHEGHGRNSIEELDISRTMGWFTTIYPLLLEKKENRISTLLNVKRNLQLFGQKDFFYCVAKYIQRHPHLEKFDPEVLFNYFGRVDDMLLPQAGGQLFKNSHERIANTSHATNRLPHLLEINSIILEGQLRISILCDPDIFEPGLFSLWINSFKKQICEYILQKENLATCGIEKGGS